MLVLLKLLQQLVKTLSSEGTPGQIAVGMALGAALGLTPLINLHNLVILAAIMVFNVSFPGAMLGWALAVPVGFALDPLFDVVGRWFLLETPALTPLWTRLYNVPVAPLTNFNNTVVLGSLVSWVVLALPIYFLGRWGVGRYRARLYPRLARSRVFQAVTASKLYNLYRRFRPD
ncbi:MAG: TIGR03546 family protein [Gemmatimonadetes bacterium]|nr:TIGR03546 family protein [Gemmatimonadota bacterium]